MKLPTSESNKESMKVIESFGCNKQKRCKSFLKSLMALHKKRGKWHLVMNKKVSDMTYTGRWYFIHALSAELYSMGYQIKSAGGIKQKHCIALCNRWEEEGLSASTIATRKSLLRVVLSWVGKKSTIDSLSLNELFVNPAVITRPQKTVIDKSLSGALELEKETLPAGDRWTDDPLQVIQNLWVSLGAVRTQSKVNRRYFIVMLELMYWLGLRPREAAFFNPGKDIRSNGIDGQYCFVVKQGSKGGRERKVLILEDGQKGYLKVLQTRMYCRYRIMPKDVSKTDSWMRSFNRFCVDNGLSKELNKNPYSLRHEYAHRTYEHISGQLSPIRSNNVARVDVVAKGVVSKQLGHNRPSVAGAYIG